MREVFFEVIKRYQPEFEIELATEKIELLADYYALILERNDILHLVAPAPVEEFVVRHVLESLLLTRFLPRNVRFADVGAGAGLPSMPCILVRDDARAVLIEAKQKKAAFLEDAAEKLGIGERIEIVDTRFEEIWNDGFDIVTSRALDKFVEKLPKMIKKFSGSKFVLFGGENMRTALEKLALTFEEVKIPQSEKRFIYSFSNGQPA